MSKEIEPGARVMLLLADGLFRFDVVIRDDTIQTIVRNLSTGALHMERDPGRGDAIAIATEEAAPFTPGSARVEFALGDGADRVTVDVVLGTLRFADRGTVRITAQAIVRQAAAG